MYVKDTAWFNFERCSKRQVYLKAKKVYNKCDSVENGKMLGLKIKENKRQ